MGVPLFVYGTLLTGGSNYHVVEPYVVQVRSGAVRGRLVDAGDYPALIIDRNGEPVAGEWLFLSAGALKVLDSFEGYQGPGKPNEYDRIWVRDALKDEEGWVYVWRDPRGCPVIHGGDWLAFLSAKEK